MNINNLYQDRLDRQREINDARKNKIKIICSIEGCNIPMCGIIESSPYCVAHHEEYFIRQRGSKVNP